MPLYGRDLLADGKVRSLLLDDRMKWWYLVLIIHQWDEGAVPLDGNACRGIVAPCMGTPAKVWYAFTELITEFFPPIDEYLGQNKRLEEIRAEHIGALDRRVEKARIAGLASGQARLKANPSPTQAQPKPNPSPTQVGRKRTIQKQSKTPPLPSPQTHPQFGEFKIAYPRRDGGQGWKRAEELFAQLVYAGDAEAEGLIATAKAYDKAMRRCAWYGTEKVKQAQTWLGPGNWWQEDYSPPPKLAAELEPRAADLPPREITAEVNETTGRLQAKE